MATFAVSLAVGLCLSLTYWAVANHLHGTTARVTAAVGWLLVNLALWTAVIWVRPPSLRFAAMVALLAPQLATVAYVNLRDN